MTIDGRDCPDLLLQIAAIRKALDNTSKLIFADHMENCLVNAVHQGNEQEVLQNFHGKIGVLNFENKTKHCDILGNFICCAIRN
jgi:DNA-binding FrmR family transcriptional regulator